MCLRSLLELANFFRKDERGNVALITGLVLVPMIGAVGYGVDYTRAVSYRMKLDSAASAASLAGVEMARAYLLANPNATPADVSAAGEKRAREVFNARAPAKDSSFFAESVKVARVGETLSVRIDYTGSVKTVVANILSVDSIGVAGSANSNGPLTLDSQPVDPDNPNVIVKENFENPGVFERGSWGVRPDYNYWLTSRSGVEIGNYSTYDAEKPPNGMQYVAELDSRENNSISKKIYLIPGQYELRYLYRDRISFPTYNPAWLCGSQSQDVDWANDPSGQFGYQTNRIGVYLQIAPTDVPPKLYDPKLHNLLDVCVSSGAKWLQRSIKIDIKAPGFFWLAFQAEGVSDGYGGLLTDIHLCKGTCAEPILDDFPWEANTVLFSDSFETPEYLGQPNWRERTLDASGVNSGWPLLPTGWTTWGENQIDFSRPRTGQYGIELDASFNRSGTTNRAISRRFILPPGYYEFQYWYRSMASLGANVTMCGKDTVTSDLSLLQAMNTSSRAADTNLMRVYVDPDRSFSHPRSEPVLNALSTWEDPDNGPETLPRLPRTVLDACAYSNAFVLRAVKFKVTKPGFYWVTLKGEGASDAWGALIDDVSLVALGSLRKSAPQPDAVDIPAPGLPAGSPIVLNNMVLAAQ